MAIRARFARYGTVPADDDLATASALHRALASWAEVLEGVYRGELTFTTGPNGHLAVHRRGLPT